MIERRKRPRLALETREPFRIPRKQIGKHFDRYLATQLRVARAIDLAHPARADGGHDFVGPDPATWAQRHSGFPPSPFSIQHSAFSIRDSAFGIRHHAASILALRRLRCDAFTF